MLAQENILRFLAELKENNNREWFAEHKGCYQENLRLFENLIDSLLAELVIFDEELKNLTAKDCVFRIYRDVRFSRDKSPYKTHFGAFIGASGGRKSERSGYYLHLEPDNSFFSVGVWCPPSPLLQELRKSIYDNIDELNEIRKEKDFARYFSAFYEKDKLKNIPRGFPKDFEQAELLKLKHYLVWHDLDSKMLSSKDFVSKIANLAKIAFPFNQFMNYSVDEHFAQ